MKKEYSTSYLLSARLDDEARDLHEFPFDLPAVRHIDKIRFDPRVTFIVGENGSGKSTVVEGLAVALGFNAEGGSKNFRFASNATHSSLHDHLIVARGVSRPTDGFFLRAESFYNVATEVDRLGQEIGGTPLTAAYGGKSLHKQSHGESFMSLVRHRFRGNGLYIMDEPEAALSVARQLELLALIHQLVQDRSQLVIATHSPILLSYPEATIYQIADGRIDKVAYEQTDQYMLTKYFLNNYKAVLRETLG